jgi:hypothetical protein
MANDRLTPDTDGRRGSGGSDGGKGHDAVDLARLTRLLRWSLALNLLGLAVNGALFYALLVFVVAEPADVDGVEPPSEAEQAEQIARERKADPRKEMREFFDRMTDLLDRAARKHGTNPADVLPAQADIDAAVETRTMHSDQSQAVMQTFREGFDYYDLDWPTVIPER